MRFKILALACAALAVLIFPGVIDFALAQAVAPDLVATLGQLKNDLLTAAAGLATLAIPIISTYVVGLIREKWSLSAFLLTQKRVDGLNAGIINIVRGELEQLRQEATPGTVKGDAAAAALPPTMEMRRQAVENAQPKVKAAFKETLAHLGKNDAQVTDMVLARVEAAVAKPEPIHIPAVMARSSHA